MIARPPFGKTIQALALTVIIGFTSTLAAAKVTESETVGNEIKYHFRIQAGPLDKTLVMIASQSNRTIIFTPALVASLKSPAIIGDFSSEQAISKAISQSDLKLTFTSNGTLTLEKKPTVTSALSDSDSGFSPSADKVSLQKIVVTAVRDQAETSFTADRSSTSTRSDAGLNELPSAVTLVTGKVIASQQNTSVTDVLNNVSGVTVVNTPGAAPYYNIRGFTGNTLTDGLSDDNAADINIAGVERVEVLKGPQSILQGEGALGGVVNVVTKKPNAESTRQITLQYGSHGEKTLRGDIGGGLSNDNRLTFRILGAETDTSSALGGYAGPKSHFFMPQLRWKDDKTDIIVGAEYNDDYIPFSPGMIASSQGNIISGNHERWGNKNDGINSREKRFFYTLEQQINNHISVVSKFSHSWGNDFRSAWAPYDYDENTGTVSLSQALADKSKYESTSTDNYLKLNFDTWKLNHSLSTGINTTNYHYTSQDYSNDDYYRDINIKQNGLNFPGTDFSQEPTGISKGYTHTQGLYAQDLIAIGNWTALFNIRRTQYKTYYQSGTPEDGYTYSSGPDKQPHNTQGAGLVYAFTPQVSAYAQYSEGFSAQTGYSRGICGGGQVPPQQSKNKEGGLKFSLLNNKLNITTSVFELLQKNVTQYEAIGSCYDLISALKTQGIELDVQGQLYEGWNLIFNYSHNKYTNTSSSNNDIVNLAMPSDMTRLWTTYDIQSAKLKGLGMGFGFTARNKTPYAGESTIDNDGNVSTPRLMIAGSVRFDGSVYYNQSDWSLNLGVKNLLDRKIYASSGSYLYIPYEEGRTYTLTYTHNF